MRLRALFSSSDSCALNQCGFNLNSGRWLPREADKVTRGSDLKLADTAQNAGRILGRESQDLA
jgi:hypothetical protein